MEMNEEEKKKIKKYAGLTDDERVDELKKIRGDAVGHVQKLAMEGDDSKTLAAVLRMTTLFLSEYVLSCLLLAGKTKKEMNENIHAILMQVSDGITKHVGEYEEAHGLIEGIIKQFEEENNG